jgi:hypothetical protein
MMLRMMVSGTIDADDIERHRESGAPLGPTDL